MSAGPGKAAMRAELQRFIRPVLLMATPADVDPALPWPPPWTALLQEPQQDRSLALHSYWGDVAARMPSIATLIEKLSHPVVGLVEKDGAVSLLYPFTTGGTDINFYRGHPPLTEVPPAYQGLWHRMPLEWRAFYLHIHDGWTFLPGNSMGPLPVDDWAFLSEDRFDIDDITAARMPVDISKVLTVFHNGAGDYLCLDFSSPSGLATGLIWWHEDPANPEVVDFWPLLDAWIGIFLEQAEPL